MAPTRAKVLACIASALIATPASALDEDDYYLSIPALGGIYRLDSETLTVEPFAVGLSIPFYGVWATDGRLYIPDRTLGAVFAIEADGTIIPFTAGGFVSTPVTVAQDPLSGNIFVSDLYNQAIASVDPDGTQHLVHDAVTSGGLLDGPGGIAFDLDGVLYVSNNVGTNVVAIEPGGAISLVTDGEGLLGQPGGLAADGAGNLFLANYGNHRIVRIDVETGATEIFSDDPYMFSPNDVKLARDGSLLVTVKNSSVLRFDALGQMTIVHADPGLGEIDGVAVPQDHPPCDGRFIPYGTGTPGSGGFVPSLRGVFSPCPGAAAALDVRGMLGGAAGSLFWGLGAAAVPFKQGTLLVDPGLPFGLIGLVYPGVGAGGGDFMLPFVFPEDPGLTGLSLFLQAMASDPGAPGNVSMSNGLEERIGS